MTRFVRRVYVMMWVALATVVTGVSCVCEVFDYPRMSFLDDLLLIGKVEMPRTNIYSLLCNAIHRRFW